MTRKLFATNSMASAPNPYGPASPAKISDYIQAAAAAGSYQQAGRAPSSHPSGQQQQQQQGGNNTPTASGGVNKTGNNMSKVLAHSTSLLASDSYLAGMSSDSELSISARYRHGRPYSSQSRVYHAHPAPRAAHTSSRMSHYSDSMASYEPSGLVGKQSVSMTPASQQQQQNRRSHLVQQVSMSSSGSGGSVSSPAAAYLHATADTPTSPLSRPLATGRQLPHRPFKQSMSIDQQQQQQQHIHHQPQHHHQSMLANQYLPMMGANRPLGSHYFDQMAASLDGAYQPGSPQHHQVARYAEPRAYHRQEMEMIEKQTGGMNFYDNEPVGAAAAALLPAAGRPVSSSSARSQLPPIGPSSGIGSMSVDHLNQINHYHPSSDHHQLQQHHLKQQEKQQQQHHQQQQQQDQAYAAHRQQQLSSSTPIDWLPPMGIAGHHINRAAADSGAAQFKQTMSIDHYPIGPASQQYAQPARQFSEHYRGSLAGYSAAGIGSAAAAPAASTNSPHGSYDSPSLHLQQSYHHDVIYGNQYAQEVPISYPSGQEFDGLQHESHLQDYSPSSKSSANSSLQQHQQQQQQQHQQQQQQHHQARPKLQHQVSSGSSNGGGGSAPGSSLAMSSNLDANKSFAGDSLQQIHKLAGQQFQHQSPQHSLTGRVAAYDKQHSRHSPLRKGYTSAAAPASSEFGSGSQIGLNELGVAKDLSSSQTTIGSLSGQIGAASLQHGGDKKASLRAASPSGAPLEASTSSGASGGYLAHSQHHSHQHQHHHSSSSARDAGGVGPSGGGSRSESSTGLPNGATGANSSSLTKKSNSATQLSMTGTKKRLGFRKKQLTSFSVHRSEEVAPLDARHLVKQGSSVSEGDSSMSGDSSSRSWSNSNFKQPTADELASMSFIDGLGKGQMISRQGLASPYLGDIQLSLCDRRGNLEIEVIRARNLQAKTSKILPLTYVKLYLVKNRKCLAKAKTTLSNKRTLDPLFQQQLTFHEDYHGCILQSIIWGNFGKMDKKNFMGIAQISIDDLELSDTVISWYKLFLPSSLQTLPSKSLRHTLLSNSTESFTTNTNNS